MAPPLKMVGAKMVMRIWCWKFPNGDLPRLNSLQIGGGSWLLLRLPMSSCPPD